MIKELLIDRYAPEEKQTVGAFFGLDKNRSIIFECDSIELPWLDNKNDISCIPAKTYTVVKRWSKKYKHHLHITNVEGRTWILIHPANKVNQLQGCIATGTTKEQGVLHQSKLAHTKLMNIILSKNINNLSIL